MKTTFYVAVEPRFNRYWPERLMKLIATKVTTKKPSLSNGAIAVKLTLEIPDEAFMPFEPAAIIHVPAELVTKDEISVEAVDANE